MAPVRTPDSIKAISFDMDGTLWHFDGVVRRSLGEVLEELDRLDPDAAAMLSVDRMIAIRDRVRDDLRGKVTDLYEIRRRSFIRVLAEAGRTDSALADRLNEVYFEHRSANMTLFDDVRPTLEALAPRYKLGIVSNGNSYAEHFGLEDLISFSVYAPDHGGIEKPDPRIFRIALELAGCTPHEMAHVGDSLEADVAGARQAGLRSVWLNRDGRQRDAVIRADREIASLRELAMNYL